MSITVTVRDNETGDKETQQCDDGDYVIITTEPCYVDGIQHYGNGTVVLTLKGRTAQ